MYRFALHRTPCSPIRFQQQYLKRNVSKLVRPELREENISYLLTDSFFRNKRKWLKSADIHFEDARIRDSLCYIHQRKGLSRVYLSVLLLSFVEGRLNINEISQRLLFIIKTLPKHYGGSNCEKIASFIYAFLSRFRQWGDGQRLLIPQSESVRLISNLPTYLLAALLRDLWRNGNRLGELASLKAVLRLARSGNIADSMFLLRSVPSVCNKELACNTISKILNSREYWKSAASLREIFKEALRLNITPNISMYNSLLSAAVESGHSDLVHSSYAALMQSGLDPDPKTISLLVKFHRRVGNSLEERSILQWYVRREGRIPEAVGLVLLDEISRAARSIPEIQMAYCSLFGAPTGDPYKLLDLDFCGRLSESQASPFKLLLVSYIKFRGFDRTVIDDLCDRVIENSVKLNLISRFSLAEGLLYSLGQTVGCSEQTMLRIAHWLSSQCLTHDERLRTRRSWEMVVVGMLANGSNSGAMQVLRRMLRQGISPSYHIWSVFVSNHYSRTGYSLNASEKLFETLNGIGLPYSTALDILERQFLN